MKENILKQAKMARKSVLQFLKTKIVNEISSRNIKLSIPIKIHV